jgi:hypothetical protein
MFRTLGTRTREMRKAKEESERRSDHYHPMFWTSNTLPSSNGTNIRAKNFMSHDRVLPLRCDC